MSASTTPSLRLRGSRRSILADRAATVSLWGTGAFVLLILGAIIAVSTFPVVTLLVPLFGILELGLGSYLGSYLKPTFIMLPFNIISEVSRTLALAIRLFGNMMSGAMIIGILLTVSPFIFPLVMTLLGLLTGMVQAYIFSILATVYIAAATRVRKPKPIPVQSVEA